MSKAFQKLVLGFGLMSLAHAAYSAAQRMLIYNILIILHVIEKIILLLIEFVDRSYLRITEQEFTTLPLDVSIFIKCHEYVVLR